MSDFDVENMAHTLVSSWAFRSAVGQWAAGLDEQPTIERQIAAALRASEAHALAHAAELCDRRAQHWHQDSSAHRELLAAADAIRALSEPSS